MVPTPEIATQEAANRWLDTVYTVSHAPNFLGINALTSFKEKSFFHFGADLL